MSNNHPKLLREGARICERAGLVNLRKTLLDAAFYIESIENQLFAREDEADRLNAEFANRNAEKATGESHGG